MTKDEAIRWLEFKSGDIYDHVFYGDEAPEWEDYEYEALRTQKAIQPMWSRQCMESGKIAKSYKKMGITKSLTSGNQQDAPSAESIIQLRICTTSTTLTIVLTVVQEWMVKYEQIH